MIGNNPAPQYGFYTRYYLVCGDCLWDIHGLIKKEKKKYTGKGGRKSYASHI